MDDSELDVHVTLGDRSRSNNLCGRPNMETMLALVKKEAKPGLWLEEVPMPRIGINDVLIQVLRDGHLRHRRAHL